MKKLIILSFLTLLLLLVSGCADTVTFQQAIDTNPVGFLHGLCHGIILPFSWVVSLFSEGTSVYAIYNNGGWYDFGFILGSGALGGACACR